MAKRNIFGNAILSHRRREPIEIHLNPEKAIKRENKKEALLSALRNSSYEKRNIHIFSRSGKWAVKIEGSDRLCKLVTSKNGAIKYANTISSSSRIGRIVLHKKDGSVDVENLRGLGRRVLQKRLDDVESKRAVVRFRKEQGDE